MHFGEALFLLAIAALLRTRKGEFTQRAMSLTSATTFTWYAGLALVVVAFFAAGLAAALGTDSFDLWAFGAGAQHVVGDACDVPALDFGVVLGADPGELGSFFASQPRYPSTLTAR